MAPEQYSITPQFESINTLLFTSCHSPWFTVVNGYVRSSGPREPHFESQAHTSALPYWHHVLHCFPNYRQPPPDFLCPTTFDVDTGSWVDKLASSSIFSPSLTKSSFLSLRLSTTTIFVVCVLRNMCWDLLASLTRLNRACNSSLLVHSKVVSSANRKLVSLLSPIVIPSWCISNTHRMMCSE